jgi:hypothetical protein
MAQTAGTNRDCHGDINGSAFWDNCNECVGGNTGQTACIPVFSEKGLKDDQELKIYPNPADGQFFITENLNGSWSVFDPSGSRLISGHSKTVDISSVSPGIYLLRANNKVVKLFRK